MVSGRTLRIAAPVAWVVGSIFLIVFWGIPTKHDVLFVWLGAGMAACTFQVSQIVRDWLPLIAVLLVYDLLRGVADGLVFPTHVLPQIRVDEAIFGKPIPTVWLQDHFWHGANHLHWWDYAAWFLHLSHFFLTFIAAAAIWVFAREHFARYSAMICTLSAVGFTTYVLFPAAPPWMAARQGDIGRSNRIVELVWQHLPVTSGGALFEHGTQYANNVAAMPSLHTAFAVLFSLYVWRFTPLLLKPVVFLYPFAMSLALVYSGEHYAVDCAAGFVYAGATYLAVNRVFDRRLARRPALEPALAE